MRLKVITALLVVLGYTWTEGACDSLSEWTLPLVNLFDVQGDGARSGRRLDLWQEGQERWIALALRGEDLYRKYVEGVRVAGFARRDGLVTVVLPKTVGKTRHYIKLQASGGVFEYGGRSRSKGWSGALDTGGWTSRLEYALDRGRHRAGLSVARSRSEGSDQQVRLEQFHRSETDHRMNSFFWELLEPTIGREIDYTWKDCGWDVEAGWLVALFGRGRLGLAARLQERRPQVGIRYFNTGSAAELHGLRRAGFRQKLTARRGVLTYQHRLGSAWRVRGEAGYTRQRLWAQIRQRDVPQSAGGVLLDLVELGDGEWSRQAVDLKVGGSWARSERAHLEVVAGWGRSTYKAIGEGTTPVLGFSLRILPISHRGEADLAGAISTWVGAIYGQKGWRKMRLEAGVLTARTEVEAQTRANAQMEFGLFVEPVQDVSRYRVALHRFFAAPSVQVHERIRLEYQLTQYLAYLVDKHRKKPKREEKARGGLIHTLMLKYLL